MMNQFPSFWDAIEKSLFLDSCGIKEIKEILTFCRYTTVESVMKFDKNSAIASLELEFINRKADLVKVYPHLENFTFASGVYSILSNIASKIKKNYVREKENLDLDGILAKVLKDAKKVIGFCCRNSIYFCTKCIKRFLLYIFLKDCSKYIYEMHRVESRRC